MKSLISIFTIVIFSVVASVNAKTVRLSEPVAATATTETFGQPLEQGLPKVELAALAQKPAEYLGERFELSAPITKVCQKKGCFFIVQASERIFRVSFKDYGFFIPTDSSGKQVVFTGELIQKDVSKEQAEHFQADLKTDSNAIQAGTVYEIVADSIQIPIS